jgi:DNA-binding response OmpR family regulator
MPIRTLKDQELRPNDSARTILVVDDEEFILELVRRILQRAGYHVLTAPDGNTALKILLDRPASVGLVMTDIVMPGSFDGFELAERVQQIHSRLPVLFMTGTRPEDDDRGLLLSAQGRLLRKPFFPRQLLAIVGHNLGLPQIPSGSMASRSLPQARI